VCGFYGSEVAVSVNRKYGKPFRVSRRVPLASLLEIKKKKGGRREGRKEGKACLLEDAVNCCDYLSRMLDKCNTFEYWLQ
jgi:hypothetical protein